MVYESKIVYFLLVLVKFRDDLILVYYRVDVPTLSLFLRPKLTFFFSKTGETGDIYM